MTVEQSIYLNCPLERAFQAFTSPSAILCWWGDDQNYRTCEWQSELRRGGAWHGRFEAAGGQMFGASGEYMAVDPPRLVEWTWRADWEDVPKRLRMEFEPSGSGTQLHATSDAPYGPAMRAEDERGLAEILGWFERYCRGAR
jgi:uncharacterized protein YndB with AHSA1/START domain